MDLELRNKVAVITGASRGLGATSARLLAANGARLVLAARTTTDLDKVAQDCAASPGVITVPSDLTLPEAADAVRDAALKAFGRIDILINSAGASQGGVFWEIPDTVWQDSLNLKFMSTVRMMRAVIPTMIAQKYGRIVNIIGSNGMQPSARLLPGSAANAALLAVTRGITEDLAPHNVVANSVNPGPTRTERWTTLMNRLSQSSGRSVADVESDFTRQIPRGQLAEPEEIANWIVFMASDRAANMNGTGVMVDGGWFKGLG